jgi:hypothetical protein
LGGGGGGGHGTSSGLVYPAGLAGTGGINSGGNGLNNVEVEVEFKIPANELANTVSAKQNK